MLCGFEIVYKSVYSKGKLVDDMSAPVRSAGHGRTRTTLISDVAREAGVSIATVSRVLSRPEQVRVELRQRVREAVNRLGYTPNAAARSLRAKSSRAILVLTRHRWSAPFFSEVLRGLDNVFAERGYTLILGNLDVDDDRRRNLVDLMLSGRVEGAIILSGTVAQVGSRSMFDAGLPMVSIGSPVEGTHQIVTDEGEAIVRGAQALVELGHRRFLYLPGPRDNSNERTRWAALEAFFANSPVTGVTVSRAAEEGFTTEIGVASGQAFLRCDQCATAVVAVSDEVAIGFMKTVRAGGIRVPGDLSILGFDGIEFADFCEPTLSTIRQPRYELGQAGARMLLDQIAGEAGSPLKRQLFFNSLDLRASTAAPSQRDEPPN